MSQKHVVECLRCGSFRVAERERSQRLEPGECPRCRYLGWALAADLTESARRSLRHRSPDRRRNPLYLV